MAEAVVDVNELSRSFGAKQALDQICEVEHVEVGVILAPENFSLQELPASGGGR